MAVLLHFLVRKTRVIFFPARYAHRFMQDLIDEIGILVIQPLGCVVVPLIE